MDVAVFAPMVIVGGLAEGIKEQRNSSKGALPFAIPFVALSGCKWIVSGFRTTGIYSQNREAVLKHIMSATNENLNKSAEDLLGPSIVKILQENLGIGSQQTQRKKTPHSRKITPGKPTESLEEPWSSAINSAAVFDSAEELEEDFSVAHIKKGNPTARNGGKVKSGSKLQKGQKCKKNKKEDIWVCCECNEEYDEDDPHVRVECDTCRQRFHLECLGIKYKTKDYWTLNLDAYNFECFECKALFKGC